MTSNDNDQQASRVCRLPTSDGMLVVTVNDTHVGLQPCKTDGAVEITRPGEAGPIRISVLVGHGQLKLEKDGFLLVAKELSLEPGSPRAITAKLLPFNIPSDVLGPPVTP